MAEANTLCFGVWLKNTEVDILSGLDCDYVEMEFKTIAAMDEKRFIALKKHLQEERIVVKSMNCLVPAEYSVISSAFQNSSREFFEVGFERASKLGVEMVVFGSPKARKRPEHMSMPEYEIVLIRVLSWLSDIAYQYGIKIVIEPICSNESNAINTISQADEIARRIGGGIGSLCDLYHMRNMGEDLVEMRGFHTLCHCHIMNPVTRKCPQSGDGYDYRPFMTNVISTDTIRSITIEVPLSDNTIDFNRSIRFLKDTEKSIRSSIGE